MPTFLIVKTSSLGDIAQAFDVLVDLRRRFPSASIDWAVESKFYPLAAAHPLIRRAIPFDRKHLWPSIQDLRREKYDLIFDLQGNCKSGLITLLARGSVKVGYGLKSVREWPNILATHIRFNISKQQNIRSFYLDLIGRYFKTTMPTESQGIRFHIGPNEQQKIAQILAQVPSKRKIMVCPGSKWANKQLKTETLIAFLQKIDASFLLMWGNLSEKALCEEIASHVKTALVVDLLPLPTWQNLMNEVDLVIAVDSSALHLCGTTQTPSFSIFGPTSPNVFKPMGEQHASFQGACPYGRTFDKQCPVLRSCPTGACIKEVTAEALLIALKKNKQYREGYS